MSAPQASEPVVGRPGFVAHHALWTDDQSQKAKEIIRKAREADVKTVRLVFADQHGVLRGKSIVVELLESVLASGCSMASSLLLKDTAHRTVYPVWQPGAGMDLPELTGASDFVWVGDPDTFRMLPWSAGSAWLLGDCFFPNGQPVPFSTRQVCRNALSRLADKGLVFLAGLELEFHVFKMLDPRLAPRDCGQPSQPPDVQMVAHGYQFLTDNRFDELEPILEELRKTLLELGLPVRTMEAEMGPSQCELTFSPAEGIAGADNALLARSAIKQVCRRMGLHATFMCRPALPNVASSGWHLHQSLRDAKSRANVFVSNDDDAVMSACGRQYLAGLLERAREACLFATPTINGYKRYRAYSLAPNRVVWGRDNRGALLRVIGGPGDSTTHIENRMGEAAANPYLYFASQIASGLDGMSRELEPPPPEDSPYDNKAATLPANLLEAVQLLKSSELFRRDFGDRFVDYIVKIKEFELHRYLSEEITDWEQREYFELL
jgi:glutamine synthetase